MVSRGPHGAPPPQRPIDRSCEANGESLQASDEGRPPVCLYEEMNVILLHAEVKDPEALARRPPDRVTERGEHRGAPQGLYAGPRAKGHVRRVSAVMGRAEPMRYVDAMSRQLLRLAAHLD